MRCRSDDECAPGSCCSSAGYCGSTDLHCAEKIACERDADCQSEDQCCSNANACVYDSYFCSEDDADDFPTFEAATNVPSAAPSANPTNSPSLVPTNWPSAPPSTASSGHPSFVPSTSPSFSPTESAASSSSPSAQPTGGKTKRTLQLPGGGKVTECVSPNEVEVYTTGMWQNLLAVNVDFRYIINVNTTADLSTMLRRLEDVMHDALVSAKLDCVLVRRKRSLRMLTHNRPAAVSTLKDDALNSDATCDQSQVLDGFDCFVVDGGITAYYENNVTEVEVRTEYLRFVRDSIEEEDLFDSVDGVENAIFSLLPAAENGGGVTENSGNTAGFETVRTAPKDEGKAALSGGSIFMIVFLCVLALVLLYITIRCKVYPKRKQKRKVLVNDAERNNDTSSRAGSAGDDHTFDCLNLTAEGCPTGGSALQQSEKTLLRSNTTESKAVVLSDEYSENDDEHTAPSSVALSGGSIRLREHVCVDPSVCLVCSSQNHPHSKPALHEHSSQVEFEPVFEAKDDSDSDEDAATSSSDFSRQDIQRIYEVDDTVCL